MKKLFFLFFILITTYFYSNAQCSFETDYSSNLGWLNEHPAQPLGVNINGTLLSYQGCQGGSKNRIYRSHGVSLTNSWSMDFDFNFSGVNTLPANVMPNISPYASGGPGHILGAVTNGNQDPFWSSANNSTFIPTNQDAIGVTFISNNHTTDPKSFMLQGCSKNNNNNWIFSNGISLVKNTQYFIRLERLDLTHGRISIYTTAARTVIITSECFTIDPGVSTSLPTLQQGVISWSGSDRALYGSLDNMRLQNINFSGGQISSSQTILCGGKPANLTNVILASATPCISNTYTHGFTYYWESSVGCTGTWTPIPFSSSYNYTFTQSTTPVQTTCYRRVAVGPCGLLYYSNTITITVASPAVSVNSALICGSGSATLTATPVNSGGTYVWNTGATTQTIIVNPTTTTNYSVTYTLGTCSSSASGTVTVNPIPSVTINSQAVCNGIPSNPVCNAIVSPTGGTYLWNNGATTSSTSYSGTGIVFVTYSVGGCSLKVNKTITNTVLDIASPTATQNCPGNSYTLSGNGGYTNGTYVWNPTGQTGQQAIVTPTNSAGTPYSYTFSYNGCSQTSTSITLMPLSCLMPYSGNENAITTKMMEVDNSITLSPNPTNGKFNIELRDIDAEKIIVYNMQGKIIYELSVANDERSIEVDLSELPSSVYMVHINAGGKIITKKVVKN